MWGSAPKTLKRPWSSWYTVPSLSRVTDDDMDKAGVAVGVGLELRSRARASACLTACNKADAFCPGEPPLLDRLLKDERDDSDWLRAIGDGVDEGMGEPRGGRSRRLSRPASFK
jgi:hypothetical protein